MAKVLVVDDDPEIRMMVSTKLSSAGHEVVEAIDGVEGLAMVRSQSPDLVILDWMMPGMSGLEVCAAVRAESDAGVMFMTARSQPDDLRRATEVGADAFVVKPFSPRELLEQVDDVLAVHRAGQDVVSD